MVSTFLIQRRIVTDILGEGNIQPPSAPLDFPKACDR